MCVYLMLRVVTCACVLHTGRAGCITLALGLGLGFGVAWALAFPCTGACWSRRCASFAMRPLFQALGPVCHLEEVPHTG